MKKNSVEKNIEIMELYDKATFSSNLVKTLLDLDFTEEEGAALCNIEPHTFSCYLRGVFPDSRDLEKLERGLDVSRAYLTGETKYAKTCTAQKKNTGKHPLITEELKKVKAIKKDIGRVYNIITDRSGKGKTQTRNIVDRGFGYEVRYPTVGGRRKSVAGITTLEEAIHVRNEKEQEFLNAMKPILDSLTQRRKSTYMVSVVGCASVICRAYDESEALSIAMKTWVVKPLEWKIQIRNLDTMLEETGTGIMVKS